MATIFKILSFQTDISSFHSLRISAIIFSYGNFLCTFTTFIATYMFLLNTKIKLSHFYAILLELRVES
jgi:hypothetical protein